jgi:hypothetical protein
MSELPASAVTVQAFLDAYSTRDLDRFLAQLADDVVIEG